MDDGIMECTLDADNTGKDCLLNISQRLGLHQPEFFGLRYISRGVPPRQRWVELERPLKKQLEKHAQDCQLSLGVMFYVADVNLLKDEMARYHYFLQLKSDVIDGKLNCNTDQAISLAAYSLQAEFGDYDPERHTIEYLRDFAILPKMLTSEHQHKYQDLNVDALFEAVARQYSSLIGFPPPLAEIYYIMVAQQLDGYGQEAYPAKDDAGNDILICVSATALVIRRRDWTHIAVFRWNDIKSIIGHKRLFVVESAKSQRTMQFHFTDPEVAKYVQKMCLLQSSFFKENMQADSNGGNDNVRNNNFNMDGMHGNTMQGMRVTPDLLAVPSLSRNVSGSSDYSIHNSSTNSFLLGGNAPVQLASFNMSVNMNIPGGCSTTMLGGISQPTLHNSMQEMSLSTRVPTLQLPDLAGNFQLSQHPHFNVGLNRAPELELSCAPVQALLHSYPPAPAPTSLHFESALQQITYNPGTSTSSTSAPTSTIVSVSSGAQDVLDSPIPNQSASTSTTPPSNEEEPIYQNGLVSQMHSIELRDSRLHSRSNPEVVNAAGGSVPLVTVSTGNKEATVPTSSTGTTSSHPHLYILKPPPPYPGPIMKETSSSSFNSDVNVSGSGGLLPSNQATLVSVVTTTQPSKHSSSSGSSATAVVSAQVHTEPGEQEGQEHSEQSDCANSAKVSISSAECCISSGMQAAAQTIRQTTVIITSGTDGVLLSPQPQTESPLLEQKIILESDNSESLTKTSSPPVVKQKAKMTQAASSSSSNVKNQRLYGKMEVEPQVLQEFQGIAKAKTNSYFTTALKRENAKRNRCPDVLPYEDNAIRLSPSRHNPSGYINASPVSTDLIGRVWKYIVGQIPLAGNAPAVWQMIWEKDVKIVVVLERDSSALFYPTDSGSTMTFNDFQVVEGRGNKRSSTLQHNIAREFTLTYLPKKKPRQVWLLPYEDEWKDDVPIDTEHFLCFLEEVNCIQRRVGDTNSPLAVLCGSGAGRSGVLILADLLLHAADANQKLRCDTLVGQLRTQRMMLVSTVGQYAFLLRTLTKQLSQSRLI